MISDFLAFMGVSPAAYLAGRLPPVTPCAAIARLQSFAGRLSMNELTEKTARPGPGGP